ncbi:hypothetical protein SAMN04490185_2885 [Pseudomonas frederiksbergensis]|uniref:Uncharacterized protein n=1 Tax=Pseudomonas frederiksbergensis TaxID=104087 RepID=A0A1H4YEP3_9PSED|nr:hypothetical protein SAMN04490185_2885 [Pseudomonas frederiksbergensis]
MLDRTAVEERLNEMVELERSPLTKTERRLICYYRQLAEGEQRQLKRLAEVLVINPERSSGC